MSELFSKPHRKNNKPAKTTGEKQPTHTIHYMPDEDRPRERLQKLGAGALTDSELLAILLRVGVQGENVIVLSQRLLREYDGLLGLCRTPFEKLKEVRGMGEAKAAMLKAALEIGSRMDKAQTADRFTVRSPKDLIDKYRVEMAALEQEHLRLIMLNTKNQIIKEITIYKGTVNSSQVRIAELFKEAVRHNATSIILLHNHPSGDPTPSREDVRITELVIEAGKLLEVELLDHIVLGHNNSISLREKGLAFKD